jgi:hypothetical protein
MNDAGGFFGTALQAAASQRHLEAAGTVPEHGANPNNASRGHYGTALAAAVALKFDEIVSPLIAKGVDHQIVDDHSWSAATWSTLRDWRATEVSLESNGYCESPSSNKITLVKRLVR